MQKKQTRKHHQQKQAEQHLGLHQEDHNKRCPPFFTVIHQSLFDNILTLKQKPHRQFHGRWNERESGFLRIWVLSSDSLKPNNFQAGFGDLPTTRTSITFLLDIYSTASVESSVPTASLSSNPFIAFILSSHPYLQETYRNLYFSLQPLPFCHISMANVPQGCTGRCASVCANTLCAQGLFP